MEEQGYVGHAPKVLIRPIDTNPEAARYRKAWEREQYRIVSPGEQNAFLFLGQAKPRAGSDVIDFGCGTGRGAFMLALFGGMKVTMLDFAENCLDKEVREALTTQADRLSFKVADLTKPLSVTATYGYCCDVMEHIPTEDVPTVLRNILLVAQHTFFAISTVPDIEGANVDGHPLHLTVQPMAWWLDRLREAGAMVHWYQEREADCFIYCSAWKDAEQVLAEGRINTDMATVEQQVLKNVRDGWKHAVPYDRQDRQVVVLAGGPTLNDHVDKIRELRESGCALVTVNGSYTWAIEHGLVPSMQIVIDARPFNARFVTPVVDTCLYLIASQAHPSVLSGLPRERTFLWHAGVTDEAEALIRERTKHFFPIPGGSTVILRAIPLLRMLGFWRLHLFGFDSCVRKDESKAHHAYAQAENDGEPLIPLGVGGRQFWCTPWHISQAHEFRGLIQSMGDEVELEVYGDGLIAHMIQTGAELAASASALKEDAPDSDSEGEVPD